MNSYHRGYVNSPNKFEKITGFENLKFKALNIGREYHTHRIIE